MQSIDRLACVMKEQCCWRMTKRFSRGRVNILLLLLVVNLCWNFPFQNIWVYHGENISLSIHRDFNILVDFKQNLYRGFCFLLYAYSIEAWLFFHGQWWMRNLRLAWISYYGEGAGVESSPHTHIPLFASSSLAKKQSSKKLNYGEVTL